MADLNIRNVDPELIAKLKADAALGGYTLRDYCLSLLSGSSQSKSVYVMLDPSSGLHKIGISQNVESRRVTLGARLQTVFVKDVWNAAECEQALHRHFAANRKHGEWFSLSADDVEWIKSWPLSHPNRNGQQSTAMTCECHPPTFVASWETKPHRYSVEPEPPLPGQVIGRMWECDECRWRWMYVEGRMPAQCPKCRSRKWNAGAVAQSAEHPPRKRTVEGSIPSGTSKLSPDDQQKIDVWDRKPAKIDSLRALVAGIESRETADFYGQSGEPESIRPVPTCSVDTCGKPLVGKTVRGVTTWACADVSCPTGGREQKGRK